MGTDTLSMGAVAVGIKVEGAGAGIHHAAIAFGSEAGGEEVGRAFGVGEGEGVADDLAVFSVEKDVGHELGIMCGDQVRRASKRTSGQRQARARE